MSETLVIELQLDTEVEDALDLGVEHVARQPVFGNAEAHHAARERSGVDDLDAVAEAPQMIGGRKPRGSGADDQHPLAALGGGRRKFPALLDRFVAEKALDGVDARPTRRACRGCTRLRTGDSTRGP